MDSSLTNPSQAMNREIQAAMNTLHCVEQDLARRAEQARANLDRKSEPSFFDVQETARQLQALGALQAKADKSDDGRSKEKEQSDRTIARWKAARVQLEARAGVDEVRKDSDPFWVSDASLAGRAMQAVLVLHTATPEAAKTQETLRSSRRPRAPSRPVTRSRSSRRACASWPKASGGTRRRATGPRATRRTGSGWTSG
jgi:hypothetical protein